MTDEERKERERAYMREYLKAYREKPKNRARKRELANAWNAAHPEQRRAKDATYRAANREKLREQHVAWRAAHPERPVKHRRTYRETHRDEIRRKAAAYRASRKDAISTYHRERYTRQSERIRTQQARYRSANGDKIRTRYGQNKEKYRVTHREWAAANPHVVAASRLRRRAAEGQAQPLWADQEAIRAIYLECARLTKSTGVSYEVDHIYPIQGRTVCGLHVPANLQIITTTENRRKGNRLIPHLTTGPL